jgi:enoyl-CoA hydratase/carnithine racemase
LILINAIGYLKVAIIDGIVMGGGAGLSLQGTFRIVTENTVCFCFTYWKHRELICFSDVSK